MKYTVHLLGDDGLWKPEPRLCKDCCHSIADARDAVRQMHANGIAAFFHRDARIFDADGDLVDEILFPSSQCPTHEIRIDGQPAPPWWPRLVATVEDMTDAERMVAEGIAGGIAAYLASIDSPQAATAADIFRQLTAGVIDCQIAAFALDDLTDDHP